MHPAANSSAAWTGFSQHFQFMCVCQVCRYNVKTEAHHGEPLLSAAQVVADAPSRQQVGEAGHLVEDPALRHHNEEGGNQREAGKGADDIEGILGGGVITLPGDCAGQSVRLGDVLAPAEQREAGPHCSNQPDSTAQEADVGSFQPHSYSKKAKKRIETARLGAFGT